MSREQLAKLFVQKTRKIILEKTSAIIDQRFERRIKDMELFARIFYASILSSYTRANAFGNEVGIVLPELEAITKALYAMSSKKKGKTGSFETSKAFEVARSLQIRYRIPLGITDNKLKYKMTFTITHPLLIALEEGEVSWQNMEKSKIVGILQSALFTLESKQEQGRVNRKTKRPIEREILKAIKQLEKGTFNIIRNKRPYMEIAVKNLIKQKDFIDILIK